MTQNNKEISPVISGIRFMEPAFNTQYSIVLHHDKLYNYNGTEELVNYPYFRHYGIINTTAEKNLPVNYQNTNLYDPLDFLKSIHLEQDGWHWLLITTTDSEKNHISDPNTNYLTKISIPENRKRNFEDSKEKYSHDQEIKRYHKKLRQNYEKTIVPIMHVCSSTCKASFHKRPSSTNQFTNPPWCGVCAMQYFGDYMMKVINNGDNRLFITYHLGVKHEKLKWVITNLEMFDV